MHAAFDLPFYKDLQLDFQLKDLSQVICLRNIIFSQLVIILPLIYIYIYIYKH